MLEPANAHWDKQKEEEQTKLQLKKDIPAELCERSGIPTDSVTMVTSTMVWHQARDKEGMLQSTSASIVCTASPPAPPLKI